MPSFMLRNIDAALMARVKAQAESEGLTVKAAILKMFERYGENVMTQQNSLSAGTIYANLDDAIRAATCLCGLHEDGATIYGTADGKLTAQLSAECLESGEAYVVVVPDGEWSLIPETPYEPIYTITKPKVAR